MKKLLISCLVLGVVAVSGCTSVDPLLRSRFDNQDGAYGAGYTAVAPGSWHNLQHADSTCNGSLSYTREEFMVVSASMIRMPYDIVVDVLLLPYDVYKMCRIDWREEVKDY
jgi:uncharacterized protein YceK